MPFVDPPPPPPPPHIRRVNPDGTPTPAWVEYETRLREWQKRLAASIS